MKTFYINILALLVLMVGCSTTPQQKVEDQNDKIIAHLEKGKRIIGKDFDEKFTKEGLINGEYVAIGSHSSTKNTANSAFAYVKAEEDSKSKLLNSAPTEFKKVIQNAISTISGTNEVDHVTITVAEVRALTGLSSGFNDRQCVTFANPTEDLKYEYIVECRVLTRVPASNLMKAYNYTLDKKYSVKEDNQIKDILKQQLMDKVLDQPVVVKPLPQVTSNQ